MPGTDYIANFEAYMMRCNVRTDSREFFFGFKMGLLLELRNTLMFIANTLLHAYQEVQHAKRCLRLQIKHQWQLQEPLVYVPYRLLTTNKEEKSRLASN